MAVEEGEETAQARRVRALEARAADHHVDTVVKHIGVDAAPEQLDRPLRAVGREHAGAAELEEAPARMGLDERPDVELAGRVEAALPLGHLLAEEAIGSDDRRGAAGRPRAGAMVEDEEMVAICIEARRGRAGRAATRRPAQRTISS